MELPISSIYIPFQKNKKKKKKVECRCFVTPTDARAAAAAEKSPDRRDPLAFWSAAGLEILFYFEFRI